MSSRPVVLLTHDIDILSISELPFFSKTHLGLFYRLLINNFIRCVRGKLSVRLYLISLLEIPKSLVSRFWKPYDLIERSTKRMIDIEVKYGVPSTYFFIPKPRTPGHLMAGVPAPQNRQCYYQLSDHRDWISKLVQQGHEIGVHTLDAHYSSEKGAEELAAFREVFPFVKSVGTRSHWLYQTPELNRNLAAAGFAYDCTLGWNEKIGIPENGLAAQRIEGTNFFSIPTHIQDGALFDYMVLSSEESIQACKRLLDDLLEKNSHLITILWHNNSFEAPRFWSDCYEFIIQYLQEKGCSFMTVSDYLESIKPS